MAMTETDAATLLYFAYGSNLLAARLRAPERTPSAICRGRAWLDRHQLRFHKQGQDGSGKADAYFTGSPKHELPGRLFELPLGELETLDRVEGVGSGYERATVTIRTDAGGGSAEAQTYRALAEAIDADAVPFDWYLELVRAGAAEIGLPTAHQTTLRSQPVTADSDIERSRRARALLPANWHARGRA